jgi:transposase
MNLIKSSRHKIHPNAVKTQRLQVFVDDYKSFVSQIIDHVWLHGYNDYQPSHGQFKHPKFFDSTFLSTFKTSLGGMLRQTAGLQALAMLKAATTKHSKRVYMLKKLQQNNIKAEKDVVNIKRLQSKINSSSLVKPTLCSKFKITISRPDVIKVLTHNKADKKFSFDEFVKLSLAGDAGVILIPLNQHKHSKKLQRKGYIRKLSAINLLGNNLIDLIWEIEQPEKVKEGKIVGCDQGITTTLTMSDGQVTKENKHGWNLTKIQHRLVKRKAGSNGTRKAQELRKNYINWSLNQLNFNDVSTVNLEKVFQIRKGKCVSKFQKSWSYPLIKQKLIKLSDTKGFSVVEVPNKFRSQRCNHCGYVNKSNRKGKTFKCIKCSYTDDADMNAASNLELCLPEVPYWVFKQQINRKEGFFWTEKGVVLEEQVIPLDIKADG